MNILAGGFALRQRLRAFSTVFDLLDDIEYRAIETPDDLDDVFRLRYRAYRARNYMEPRGDGQCHDELDEEANTRIFGVYQAGRLIASIRIHLLERPEHKSASMRVFPEVLLPHLAQGRRFIDSSRFAIDPDLDAGNGHLHYITMRLSVLACVHHRVDYSLSLVRPTHGAFYRRYFGFEQWAEGRTFPGLTFPVNLYSADIAAVHDHVLDRLPFLNSLPAEQRLLFDREAGKRSCYSVRSTARLAVAAIERRRAAGTALGIAVGEVAAFA
ncbi:MAG: hypothetical protein BroJett030_01620 [Alphaproteobacteria bacterium]|nr:MAG: hypothetical protein BroJett030_01620 [Alphaproteobacteria bacterium]